jgi:hypothetical protein
LSRALSIGGKLLCRRFDEVPDKVPDKVETGGSLEFLPPWTLD